MSATTTNGPLPPPPPTDVSNPDPHSGGNSSNLYLVTFLATLFLLLFVSCAILLRSYVIRRNYQRRLDEALQAGMFLAPRAQGSKRKRFGTRPKLYDTWVSSGGSSWESTMPLSAQPMLVKRKYKDASLVPPHAITIANPPMFVPRVRPIDRIRRHLAVPSFSRWQRNHVPAADIEPDDAEGDTPPQFLIADEMVPSGSSTPTAMNEATPVHGGSVKVRVEMLQVCVLISMPSPPRSLLKNRVLDKQRRITGDDGATIDSLSIEENEDDVNSCFEDEDEVKSLPEVVFGVTRVSYDHRSLTGNLKTIHEAFPGPAS